MSGDQGREPTFTPIELESVKLLRDVEKITSLSEYTIRRRYSQFLVKLSARRTGMKLKHALSIASGTLPAA
jgi:hypothetical protein